MVEWGNCIKDDAVILDFDIVGEILRELKEIYT